MRTSSLMAMKIKLWVCGSYTLMMEAGCSPGTLLHIYIYQCERRHMTEYRNIIMNYTEKENDHGVASLFGCT
jgi:hypothetical protein